MRKGSTLLVTAVAAILLLTASLPPLTRAAPAGVYSWPEFGPPGIWVEVHGYGFTNYTTVMIYFDDELVGTTETWWYGEFWTYIEIPATSPGTHTIKVVDTEGITATTTFRVTAPRLLLTPSSGPVGTLVTVSGSGLGPWQCYALKFDDVIISQPVLFTLEDGTLPEFNFTVPSSFVGPHNLTLVYVGFCWRWEVPPGYILSIEYVSSPKAITFATFNVTIGTASSEDVAEILDMLDELGSKVSDLAEQLASEVSRLDDALANLSRDVTEEFSRVNKVLASMEAELTELAGRAEELVANLTAVSATLSREVSRLDGELSRLNSEFEEKLEALAAELSNVKGELAEGIDAIATGLSNLRTRVEEEVTRLSGELGDVRTLTTNISGIAILLAAAALGAGVFALKGRR